VPWRRCALSQCFYFVSFFTAHRWFSGCAVSERLPAFVWSSRRDLVDNYCVCLEINFYGEQEVCHKLWTDSTRCAVSSFFCHSGVVKRRRSCDRSTSLITLFLTSFAALVVTDADWNENFHRLSLLAVNLVEFSNDIGRSAVPLRQPMIGCH